MSSVLIDPKVNMKIKLTLFNFFIDLNQVRRHSEFNMDENEVVRNRFSFHNGIKGIKEENWL